MAEQTLIAALQPAVALGLGLVLSLTLAGWLRGRRRPAEKPVPARVIRRKR